MNKLLVASILLSFASGAAHAQTQIYNKKIGSNSLDVTYDFQTQTADLNVNGSPLTKIEDVGNPPDFFGPFTFKNQIVEILESESGGTGCPAQFYALWFNPKPVLSKPFGNCDDSPSIEHSAAGIQISMDSNDGGVDKYTIDTTDVHSAHAMPQEIVSTASLYSQILSFKGTDILSLKSMKDAVQALIGAEKLNDLSECLISASPTSIYSYAIAESLLPPHNNCDYAPVLFVVDKNNDVWIGMKGRQDANMTWYGNPSADVLQAVDKFNTLQNQ